MRLRKLKDCRILGQTSTKVHKRFVPVSPKRVCYEKLKLPLTLNEQIEPKC